MIHIKPLIGIATIPMYSHVMELSMAEVPEDHRDALWRYGRLFMNICGCVTLAGGVPVGLAATDSAEDTEDIAASVDGLLISGGEDVNPALYGQGMDGSVGVCPIRDRFEMGLLKRAISHNIPVLGICRGAQIMNVAAGGTLKQDLGPLNETHRMGEHYAEQVHDIDVTASPYGLISEICGVNSIHHQAADRLGARMMLAATGPGDIKEAYYMDGHPFYLGVQWHPECMPWCPDNLSIFRALINESLRARNNRLQC